MSENVPSDMCAQRRFKSTCAFSQSDQNLHWVHFWIAKDATFLHVDNEYSDQTAGTHMSEGTLSQVAAKMFICFSIYSVNMKFVYRS